MPTLQCFLRDIDEHNDSNLMSDLVTIDAQLISLCCSISAIPVLISGDEFTIYLAIPKVSNASRKPIFNDSSSGRCVQSSIV